MVKARSRDRKAAARRGLLLCRPPGDLPLGELARLTPAPLPVSTVRYEVFPMRRKTTCFLPSSPGENPSATDLFPSARPFSAPHFRFPSPPPRSPSAPATRGLERRGTPSAAGSADRSRAPAVPKTRRVAQRRFTRLNRPAVCFPLTTLQSFNHAPELPAGRPDRPRAPRDLHREAPEGPFVPGTSWYNMVNAADRWGSATGRHITTRLRCPAAGFEEGLRLPFVLEETVFLLLLPLRRLHAGARFLPRTRPKTREARSGGAHAP